MAFLANISTQQEILWDSNLMIAYIMLFLCLIASVFFSFGNILTMDEHEYKNNLQTCFKFKKKMFFIFSYTKNKKIISKKTFITECLGYLLLILVIVSFFVSLFLPLNIALYLWFVLLCCFIAPYAIATGIMRGSALEKKKYWRKKGVPPPIKLTEEEKAFIVRFKQKKHPDSYSKNETEGTLFLETVDYDVCPLLLNGNKTDGLTYANIMAGYHHLLETVDQTKFDAYTKEYLEELQTVMQIFEKHTSDTCDTRL